MTGKSTVVDLEVTRAQSAGKLRKLAEFLRTLEPHRLDMEMWSSHRDLSECDSAACGLGWASAVFPEITLEKDSNFNNRSWIPCYGPYTGITAAEAFFGVSCDIAETIFRPDEYPADMRSDDQEWAVKPESVAKRLEDSAKLIEVPHSIDCAIAFEDICTPEKASKYWKDSVAVERYRNIEEVRKAVLDQINESNSGDNWTRRQWESAEILIQVSDDAMFCKESLQEFHEAKAKLEIERQLGTKLGEENIPRAFFTIWMADDPYQGDRPERVGRISPTEM